MPCRREWAFSDNKRQIYKKAGALANRLIQEIVPWWFHVRVVMAWERFGPLWTGIQKFYQNPEAHGKKANITA